MKTIISFLIILTSCCTQSVINETTDKEPIIFLDDKQLHPDGHWVYRYEVDGEIIYSDTPLKVSELEQFRQLEKNRELLNKIKAKQRE